MLSAITLAAVATACNSGSESPATQPLDRPTTASPHSTTRSPAPKFSPTQPLVTEAHWVHYPEGWRVEVMPSIYGRNHSPEAVAATLAELLHLAPPPFHLTHRMRRSLFNQLACHADFAPRKPLWDLESWRPNVGYYRTVEALCNPGGGF